MTNEPALLVFDDVTLGYAGVPVLRHLSFSVRPGEFLGIVGPNGAGKSTVLRAILGLIRPMAGHIHVPRRPFIGYVPQREHIDTIMPVTAMEVALMGRAARLRPFARPRRADYEAARQALAEVGVAELADRLFRDLSGGQQQRVLLARALAAEPELLVLDEPTNGMDLAGEHAIVEFLVQLNRAIGMTILLVTHLLPIVLNAASSILLMETGRTLYGEAQQVLRDDTLSELYGLPVRVRTHGHRRTLLVGDEND